MKFKKLNNKGFAITSILYAMLLFALLLMTLVLLTISRKKMLVEKTKEEAEKVIDSKFYTIEYDCNGGIGEMPNSKIYTGINRTYSLRTNSCIKNNYMFKGWSLSQTGDVLYQDREQITDSFNIDNNSIIKLYAIWGEYLRPGEAIELGGYKWHIIGETNENLTLLMDAGQIDNMAHCTNDEDESTDCGVSNGYYVYSWDKSLINKYLKETLYPELKNKITNEIVPVSVCVDPSRRDGKATYGGYLKTEIDEISGASCSSYETNYVRLITYSEYWNISPYYSETNTSYPNISGITRLSTSSDYANWLYCSSSLCGNSSGYWWTMTSYSYSNHDRVRYVHFVGHFGNLSSYYGMNTYGVRPVITIKK